MKKIQHVWFDFSDTLAFITDAHRTLLYQSFADAVGEPVSPAVIEKFKELHKKYNSHSAVFTVGLGLLPGYWADCVQSADPATLYTLADPHLPQVLEQLHSLVPVSIFSNMRMETLLPAIGLKKEWFTQCLSGSEFKNPKPALDGFYKMIELSNLPPEHILFIGDSVQKEILPAKKVGMMTGIVWSTAPEADFSFCNFEEILVAIQKN
ncbi:MAG: HAD family hydrolase [Candidatus Peribacteraceae bacterium]|nr:HAD family hydrolase [Candidatus Peribacteraceae bacterium]